MEKRCWARGSGRGGSRAGVDATGRGGTAHNGLPSKGPATALVGGTSGQQPSVWALVETCRPRLLGQSVGSAAQQQLLQPPCPAGMQICKTTAWVPLPPAAGHAAPRRE